MRTLILFRHAKAANPAPGQGDFDRPLTERGRGDAARMGSLLARYPLDRALVSAARRTQETWQLASAALDAAPQPEVSRDLYLSGAQTLIGTIRETPPEVAGVVVVGHNPDMHEVALWLADAATGEPSRVLRQKFPTAALAIFEVTPGGWSDIGPKTARLLDFVTPAETAD